MWYFDCTWKTFVCKQLNSSVLQHTSTAYFIWSACTSLEVCCTGHALFWDALQFSWHAPAYSLNGIRYALQVCPVHMQYWLQIRCKYTAVILQTDMGSQMTNLWPRLDQVFLVKVLSTVAQIMLLFRLSKFCCDLLKFNKPVLALLMTHFEAVFPYSCTNHTVWLY